MILLRVVSSHYPSPLRGSIRLALFRIRQKGSHSRNLRVQILRTQHVAGSLVMIYLFMHDVMSHSRPASSFSCTRTRRPSKLRYCSSLPNGNSCCDVHRQSSNCEKGVVLADHEVSERTTRNRYLSLSRDRECLDGTLTDLQSDSSARFLLSARHTIRNLQNGDITPFFFEDSVDRSFPSLKDVKDCVVRLEVVLPSE